MQPRSGGVPACQGSGEDKKCSNHAKNRFFFRLFLGFPSLLNSASGRASNRPGIPCAGDPQIACDPEGPRGKVRAPKSVQLLSKHTDYEIE